MRIKLYNFLVNRHSPIQKKYYKLRREKQTPSGRLYAWVFLLWMNFCWLLGFRKWKDEVEFPDKQKRISANMPESTGSLMEPPEQFAKKLLQADIISFDIFDTLIFRPFVVPSDLFFAVGQKLGYMDFENIRKIMEWSARKKAYGKTNSYEVTLEQIYEELEYQAGVPKAAGMNTEIETELEFCFGNPYMQEVFQILNRELEGTDKKIICVSDMYLPSLVLKQLLVKCGFQGIHEVYVSCEAGASKSEGSLFGAVEEKIRAERNLTAAEPLIFVHIGDNPISDWIRAKESGWRHHLYKNVNVAGMPYRAEEMSAITGSLYRAIANARIHNGLKVYGSDYELGYLYGGLFVLGYCQFIHKQAAEQKADKILFLSRDGDILCQVYNRLFSPDKGGNPFPNEYVYWSRTVATKMVAKYFKYDYLRRFIDHKVNKQIPLSNIFAAMGLTDMLPKMSAWFSNLGNDTYLTDKNAPVIKEYLLSHWEKVLSHYADSLSAGKKYYKKVLCGCKKVLAVDVGWAGSGAITLDHIVNHIWNLNCRVNGVIAGTNTWHNAEPNASEQFLFTGSLTSYLYSQEHNRDFWKFHNPALDHNLLIEMLLSSEQGSFTGFETDEAAPEGYRLHFKDPDISPEKVRQIQRGILDFTEDYLRYVPLGFRHRNMISGGDAYAVLKILLQSDLKSELETGI